MRKNKIIIIGTSNLAREAYEIVKDAGLKVYGFLGLEKGVLKGKRIYTSPLISAYCAYVLAVGDPRTRKKIAEKYRNLNYTSIVHPSSVLGEGVELGKDVLIQSHNVITCNTIVEDHVYINVGCCIGHDCNIGKYSVISPHANIMGKCTLGEGVFIGCNATLRDGITIGKWSIVGMGSVVVKDVPAGVVVVGNPARIIKRAAGTKLFK